MPVPYRARLTMESKSSDARTRQRRLPRQAVTVAVRKGETPLTYGVVSNISETGACVLTDKSFPFDTELDLTLSFYRRVELFTFGARIVWARPSPSGTAIELGMEFKDLTDADRQRLAAVLGSEDFPPLPPYPGPPKGS
jgi:hypothetical protein